jgi:hypothetical protein
MPAVPFNATVWPTGVQPLSTNAEIVRVTAISTDTLTITRAQESTTARTIVVGDQFSASITNKTLNDLEYLPYVAKTAAYTIAATDYIINCTANRFTVTLPTAVSIAGRSYIIKNSGTSTITVATTSSQTIDGATTFILQVQYQTVTVVSNGANWIII